MDMFQRAPVKPEPLTKVDYAVQAKAALRAVERGECELAGVLEKIRRTREDWRNYGDALLKQRSLPAMASQHAFGAWIRANGLDTGLAADRRVRSDAMWLAANWSNVDINGHRLRYSHPSNVRTECRKLGFEWAGAKPNRDGTPNKSKAGQYSFIRIAGTYGLLSDTSGKGVARLREDLRGIDPGLECKNREHEPRLRAACQQLAARRATAGRATAGDQPQDFTRADLSATAQQRFDRAFAKANLELQQSFQAEVAKRTDERLGAEAKERIDSARKAADRAETLERIYRAKLAAAKDAAQLLLSNWRTLAACLHPDRAPPDRRAAFENAMTVANKIKDAFDALDVATW